MPSSETFQHVDRSCFKKPCRNGQHWKLTIDGREVKDTVKRIDAMRNIWHGGV